MLFGNSQHTLDLRTRTLLAERHLKNGRVNRLASNLSCQKVQFPVGDFPVSSRILVL